MTLLGASACQSIFSAYSAGIKKIRAGVRAKIYAGHDKIRPPGRKAAQAKLYAIGRRAVNAVALEIAIDNFFGTQWLEHGKRMPHARLLAYGRDNIDMMAASD